MFRNSVVGIKIHSINQYVIHIFPRSGTGRHGNDYVKISYRGVKGKYLLSSGWESEPELSKQVKQEITDWIEANKGSIRQKIGALK